MVKPAILMVLMRHESIETTLSYYVELDADDISDGPVSDVLNPYSRTLVVVASPFMIKPKRRFIWALVLNDWAMALPRFTSPEPLATTLPAPSGAILILNTPGPGTAFAVPGTISMDIAATNNETLAPNAGGENRVQRIPGRNYK
jgi:hypothetical protein